MKAKRIRIHGVVQGVGFRPYIYRTARSYRLKGWVCNDIQGVNIHVEGKEEKLDKFIADFAGEAPPAAIIKEVLIKAVKVEGYSDFTIKSSNSQGEKELLISPDLAICDQCRQELYDPEDRRYHYPFINCTRCGPRFTIIKDLPYDRSYTTMQDFPMCKDCSREYNNPDNRRFHAQPNACPDCGPEVSLLDNNLKEVRNSTPSELLEQGYILAVKGLGGYHLVCNAFEESAIHRLRILKKRLFKPFAVMAKNMETVRKYCLLSPMAGESLKSSEAPILILPKRGNNLPGELAPGVDTLGVMLPYTPLHLMLFNQYLELLVVTSANNRGEPLIYKDKSLSSLTDISDYILTHNRIIYNRCDDSVVRIIADKPRMFRRARGYVPLPLEIPEQISVLACGGDLKNTFCLTKNKKAFISQHMGNLENYGNLREYELSLKRFSDYFDVEPELIIVDKHPGYISHNWGMEQGKDYLEVQHHHAHLASCLVDNGLDERVLGVICDGTGYGLDGNIWGMEFIVGDFYDFQRKGHLNYVPLPGGEQAIHNPLYMTISYIYSALGETGLDFINDFLKPIENKIFSRKEYSLLIKQIERPGLAPLTSSCGRIFAAVSALLGICRKVNYRGEASIKLEAEASAAPEEEKPETYNYDFEKNDDCLIISTKKMWEGIIEDIIAGREREIIAMKFHITLVDMIVETCCRLQYLLDSNKVVLSGGVMQNKILVERLIIKLRERNLVPLLHSQIPAGDGGLSVGQAVIGGRWAASLGRGPKIGNNNN